MIAEGQPTIFSAGKMEELVQMLRLYVSRCQNTALQRHDTFKIAVSGGSLPKTLASALLSDSQEAQEKFEWQWDKWHIFFADERAVPLDHEDSNYRLLKKELIDKIPGDKKPHLYPIDVQYLNDPQELADTYEQELVRIFANRDSVKLPIFDLILLGCGPDGHTCSLFPGHEVLNENVVWVAPVEDSPKPPPCRVTLTLPVVTHASFAAFVATGSEKAEILKKIFDEPRARASLPAAMVNAGGKSRVSWFVLEDDVKALNYPRKKLV